MPRTFEITVNNRPVPMVDHRVTGLEIKKAAIAAGVEIEEDFQLLMERRNGELEVIDNDETVTINKMSRFRAVAPDDNS
jgi:hypothetical protein